MGRVIEVNHNTSRVLLLSDLNSNVPVTIAPQNIQAIVTGTGDKYGQIKYMKDGLSEEIEEESIIYTSGTGAIFKSGTPIGTLEIIKENSSTEFNVEFYSDFSQLKYVFAEVTSISQIPDQNKIEPNNETNNTENVKLQILEDELKIIEETNSKFIEENINLKNEINNLNNKLLILDNELSSKNITINQFNIDKAELEFLRLNLEFGHICRKSRKLFQKVSGFEPGSDEYKKCVLNKGIIIND